MHDFMKTILSALKEWVNKRIKNNTPNWNENSPEADGYIKNRPFYRDDTKTETVVQTTSFITPSSYWWDVPFVFIPIVGETYKITFDGKEYICAAYSDQYGGKCIGNLAVGNDGYPGDTGEPFFYYWYDSEDYGACIRDQGEHTITIEKINVIKIDELYLPGNLARTEELLALNEYAGYLEYQVNNRVSYTPQDFDASSKKIARNNIDAVSTEEAIIYKNTHEETVTWNGNTANATTMQFNGLTYYLLPEAPIYSFDQLVTNSVQATLSNGTIKTHTAYEGVNKCYSLGTSAETIVVVEVPKTSCSLPNYYGSSRSTVFVPKVAGVYTRGGSPYWTSFTYSVKDSGTNIYMPTHETGTKFPVKLNENGTFFEEHIPNTIARVSEIPSTEGFATEAYVNTKVAGLVDSAPETLDTLNELAAALGDDPNFATTVATKLGELETAVDSFEIPNSNLVNGSAEGSLRTVGSMAEDTIYHIGDDAFATGFETEASGACSHAEGIAAIAAGAFSHAEGRNAYAGGEASHAEGIYTYTEGDQSHAEGNTTHALGSRSHAEGYASVAQGEASHAEGSSYAYNSRSHSEGTDTVAEGHHSHSEGAYTHAKGDSSHTEGCGMTVELEISGEANALTFQYVPFGYGHLYPGMTVHYYYSEMVYRHDDGDSSTYEHTYGVTRSTLATIVAVDEDTETITLDKPLSDAALEYEMVYAYMGGVAHGEASHSEGYSTIAAGLAQHAEGAYNVIDPQHDYNNSDSRAKYIHIAGNGESDLNRSNAHALDWNGNAYYAGDVYVTGDGKNDFAGSKKLATEDFVTAALTALGLPVPTAADAGKILRVNAQGKYELVSIANAEEATF